jgi:hypothetical protein
MQSDHNHGKGKSFLYFKPPACSMQVSKDLISKVLQFLEERNMICSFARCDAVPLRENCAQRSCEIAINAGEHFGFFFNRNMIHLCLLTESRKPFREFPSNITQV